MLCDLCRNFTVAVLQLASGLPARGHLPNKYGDYEFQHGSFDTIKASAETGCQFCRFFLLIYGWCAHDPFAGHLLTWKKTSEIEVFPAGQSGEFEFHFSPERLLPGMDVEFCRPRCESTDTMVERTQHNYRQRGRSISTAFDRIPTSALAIRVPERSDSEETLSQVRSWLAQCENTHADCTRQKDVVLPTRVIDVGKLGDTQVKILETHGRSGRYLTLSYCWGRCDSYRTTTHNFSANISSIHVGALPKTLRDAVEYTRLLGFSYIWIDALCIIQDSKADWEREAAKMCTTYENATISLSILDSKSSDDGFLEDRPIVEHLQVDDLAIDLGLKRGDFPSEASRFSALKSRAWALQERILAPAVLHFAADTVYWECGAGIASQDSPHFDPNSHAGGQGSIHHVRPILRSWSTDIEIPRQHWYDLVVLYSQRGLSFESDRAAAIYGLAMKFQRCRPDRYVAGSWTADIHAGLLWQTSDLSKNEARSAVIRPSWSWLTANAMVLFPDCLLREADSHEIWSPKCRIEIANIEQGLALASEHPPYLRVSGVYEECLLKVDDYDASFFKESGNNMWNQGQCYLDASQHRGHRKVPRAPWDPQEVKTETLHVCCLLVAGQQQRDPYFSEYHYLIMEKVEREDAMWQGWISETDGRVEEDVPCFRRVGYASRWIGRRENQILFDSDTESAFRTEWKYDDTPPLLRKLILV